MYVIYYQFEAQRYLSMGQRLEATGSGDEFDSSFDLDTTCLQKHQHVRAKLSLYQKGYWS